MKPPPTRLKAPLRPVQGQLRGTAAVERSQRDGSKTQTEIPTEAPTLVDAPDPGAATVGWGMSLTIPGPKGSYSAVKVEAFVYLPCQPTNESVQQTLERCSELVQERLNNDAAMAADYFSNMG